MSFTFPAIDPWIQVAPGSIVAVGKFLRDDPRLDFKHLNDLCGSDYYEPDLLRFACLSSISTQSLTIMTIMPIAEIVVAHGIPANY